MFNKHRLVLNELVIPDIANIVVHYLKMFSRVANFDDRFIDKCVETGSFRYCNSDNLSLIHFMIEKSYWERIATLFRNYNGKIKAEHLQNRDKYNNTELYLMCHHKKYRMVKRLKELDAKYFQNKCRYGKTELAKLCEDNKFSVIKKIYKLNANHFQNKDDRGQTELAILCEKKHYDILCEIEGLTALHFQNKDNYGKTELYILCEQKEYDFIKSLYTDVEKESRLKAHHFNNIYIDHANYSTELHKLCDNVDIIKFLVDNLKMNFTDFINRRGRLYFNNDDLLLYIIKTLEINKSYVTLNKQVLPLICCHNTKVITYLLDNTDITFEDFLYTSKHEYNNLYEHNALYHLLTNTGMRVDILRKIRGLPKKYFIDNITVLCLPYGKYNKNMSDIMVYIIDKFNITIKDFCDNKKHTLLHYFCGNNYLDVMRKLEGLTLKDFQHIDGYDNTVLYTLCKNASYEMIKIIVEKFPNGNGFMPKHFNNINSNKITELGILFYTNNKYNEIQPKSSINKIFKIISENFPDGTYWNANQFLGKYILGRLCDLNMESTFLLIEKYCGKEFHWYPEHFGVVNNDSWIGGTLINKLCYNRMGNFIKHITNNFIKYNTNKNKSAWELEWLVKRKENDSSALGYLCKNNMGNIIMLIVTNFPINVNLEVKHFIYKSYKQNILYLASNNMRDTINFITERFPKNMYWKPEHLIESKYDGSAISEMCKYNMVDIIMRITDRFPKGVYWKPEHFANNVSYGSGLYHLIKNKQIQTLKSITDQFPKNVHWEPKHFINDREHDMLKRSIYVLCANKMEGTIKYITKNFDGSTNWAIPLHKWGRSNLMIFGSREYNTIIQYLRRIDIR